MSSFDSEMGYVSSSGHIHTILYKLGNLRRQLLDRVGMTCRREYKPRFFDSSHPHSLIPKVKHAISKKGRYPLSYLSDHIREKVTRITLNDKKTPRDFSATGRFLDNPKRDQSFLITWLGKPIALICPEPPIHLAIVFRDPQSHRCCSGASKPIPNLHPRHP